MNRDRSGIERLTVTLNGTGLNDHRLMLTPGQLADPAFEWLGVIARGDEPALPLARLKGSGNLVQVGVPGGFRSLHQGYAEAALARAILEAVRTALEFYSDATRYDGPNQDALDGERWPRQGTPFRLDTEFDRGEIARKALALLTDKYTIAYVC